MRHWKLLFPSKYVGAGDIIEKGSDAVVTIGGVTVQELTMEGGVKEHKPVISFTDARKDLILNKTNAKTIVKMHGSDLDGWVGKQITLYATTTKCGRDVVECIRIREKNAKPRKVAPAAALQPPPDPASKPAPVPEKPEAKQDAEAAYEAAEKAGKMADTVKATEDMFKEGEKS